MVRENSISRDEAKRLEPKINELILASYNGDIVIRLDDFIKLGLNKTQSVRLLDGFVASRILFEWNGLYSANPKVLYELRTKGTGNDKN